VHAEVYLRSGSSKLIQDVYSYDVDGGFVHLHTTDKTFLYPSDTILGVVIVN
jgi:hypothetical protein